MYNSKNVRSRKRYHCFSERPLQSEAVGPFLIFKILARLVDIGDIVEWCAAALLHRIIERWEGALADVHVASRKNVIIGQ